MSGSWGGPAQLGPWSPVRAAAQLAGARSISLWRDCPSLLGRSGPGSTPGLCRWDPGSGLCGAPSPSHPHAALSEATGRACPALCDAVWEEGRWGGSDVANLPLPSPPLLAPSLPQLGAPQPFLINGPRLRVGPIMKMGWVVHRGPGLANWRGWGPMGPWEAGEATAVAVALRAEWQRQCPLTRTQTLTWGCWWGTTGEAGAGSPRAAAASAGGDRAPAWGEGA